MKLKLLPPNPLRLLTAGKGHPIWAMELTIPSIPLSLMPPSPLTLWQEKVFENDQPHTFFIDKALQLLHNIPLTVKVI